MTAEILGFNKYSTLNFTYVNMSKVCADLLSEILKIEKVCTDTINLIENDEHFEKSDKM